jgi:hypothetical protein
MTAAFNGLYAAQQTVEYWVGFGLLTGIAALGLAVVIYELIQDIRGKRP